MKTLNGTMTNEFVNPQTGELLKIKYLPGYPLSYRFDASRGYFTIDGEKQLTGKGEILTITPIAYRIFQDDILGYGLKKWAEFFFLNKRQTICNLLVHGYSVENLMRTIQRMYYDEVSLCEVALSIKPVEKVNKASGNKYFMAEFGYELLPPEKVEALRAATSDLRIWRAETLTGDARIELAEFYGAPIEVVG